MFDVAIIGAGPAGMMAAITASDRGRSVVLVDRNPQLGRKLLATGNGRCNITNMNISIDHYHGSDLVFIENILKRFDQYAALDFFQNLGLIFKEEDNGRIFPRTNQASSVVEIMRQQLIRNNVHILLDSLVVNIEKNTAWNITFNDGKSIKAHKLILATGGKAAHAFGSTGDGWTWAKKLGHTLTPYHASLVPIEIKETLPKEIQGIKIDTKVWSTCENCIIDESTGDLLFASYGLSGPAVMALARNIAPLLHKSEVKIHIDIFPDMSSDQLQNIIQQIIENNPEKTLEDVMTGLLPSGMITFIIKSSCLSESQPAIKLSGSQWQLLINNLKDMKLTVSGLRPYKEAQVTAGGIVSSEVDPLTLESGIAKNLYFVGEMLDADGDSGGYNLQWAWSSGYVAGNSI